ncbi:hypothetical protein BKA66DRAFT_476426 [Pyrenochaeta sp. MPI-SDFR-AT-0127]|nr:hypothetical protein BKA66DRAFT_476426 [Pyrenochaeta sp. MPI-SDFR-AT-0127]
MDAGLIYLSDFRLPDHPESRLNLDGSPLCVVDTAHLAEHSDSNHVSVPIGIATVLYKWCPETLAAFLDLDAWFSLTWILTVQEGQPGEFRIEIGRIGNQITFGTLDKDGKNWTLMVTYNIILEGLDRAKWVPNPKESMKGDEDVTDPQEIDRLGRDLVKELILQKRWETGKKMRHQFFIEYAPMDVWGDGIAMNPHWLYQSLNLDLCTTCGSRATPMAMLQRCGRCGTATYCTDTCQRNDWAVHKNMCNMSMEDRGQALKITKNGGLINWDPEKTFAAEGSGEESKNPNFAEPQLKRWRAFTDESVNTDE